MNLIQMKLVKILAENGGNITSAVEQLHIAQSALSRRLQQLEAELKQNIFYRNGKRLDGLTPFGEEILLDINQALLAELNIKSTAADQQAPDRGFLAIGTTHAQARYFLPTPLQEFSQQYPHVRLKFLQEKPDELLKMLYRGEVNFIICTESLAEDAQVEYQNLYRWKHILCLPNEHIFATSTDNIMLQTITEYPLLTYIEGITGRRSLEYYFAEQKLDFQPLFSAADSDVLIEYVKAGFGIGVLCGMAREEINARGLTARSIEHALPYFETKMGWLKNRKLRKFEKNLLKILINHADSLNWR